MKKSKLMFLPPEYKEEINYDDIMPEGWAEEEMKMRFDEHKKEQALGTAGILNDLSKGADIPKKILHYDGHLYTFVYSAEKEINYCLIESKERGNRRNAYAQGYALWVKEEGTGRAGQWADWDEVSDLTGVSVFTYQRLREIAIAIGWIRDDNRTWLI